MTMPSKKRKRTSIPSAGVDIGTSNATSGLFLNSPQRPWMRATSSKSDSNDVMPELAERKNVSESMMNKEATGSTSRSVHSQPHIIALDEDATKEDTASEITRIAESDSGPRTERVITPSPSSDILQDESDSGDISTMAKSGSESPKTPEQSGTMTSDEIQLAQSVQDDASTTITMTSTSPDSSTPGLCHTNTESNNPESTQRPSKVSSMEDVGAQVTGVEITAADSEILHPSSPTVLKPGKNVKISNDTIGSSSSAHIQASSRDQTRLLVNSSTESTPISGKNSSLLHGGHVKRDDASLLASQFTSLSSLPATNKSPTFDMQSAQPTVASRLPVFDSHIRQLRTQVRFNKLVENRIALIRVALVNEDLFFLLFHQLFCLWTTDQKWLQDALRFGPQHEFAFRNLQIILSPNANIPSPVLHFLARFLNPCHLMQHNRNMLLWIEEVKSFLMVFVTQWQLLNCACLEMHSPPPARLSMHFHKCQSSPIFQRIFFIDFLNRLFPQASGLFQRNAKSLFESNQKSFFRYANIATYGPQPDILLHPDIQHFRLNFEQLRRAHGCLSLPSLNTFLSIHSNDQVRIPITATRDLVQPSMPHGNLGPDQNTDLPSHERSLAPRIADSVLKDWRPSSQYSDTGPQRPTSSRTPDVGPLHPEKSPLKTERSTQEIRIDDVVHPLRSVQPVSLDKSSSILATHNQSRGTTCCFNPEREEVTAHSRTLTSFEGFILRPVVLSSEATHILLQFPVAHNLIDQKVKGITTSDDKPAEDGKQSFRGSTISFRLRCTQVSPETSTIDKVSWLQSPSSWPQCCFVTINGRHIDLRRIKESSLEATADITSIIELQNALEVSYFPVLSEHQTQFRLAIELHRSSGDATVVESLSSP